MSTWNDIISDALYEIGAYAAGEPIDADDVSTVIRYANRLLDSWAALQRYAYTSSFQVFPLTAGHGPHLIGPGLASPDFAWPARPVRIESGAIILTDQPDAVDQPLKIRDRQWWANERVKTLQSNIPTSLFYEADFPNGALNFWPVPNFAYAARLELWTSLSQIGLDGNGNPDPSQSFLAPQGYELAFQLTLSERLVTPYARPMPPELPGQAREARAALQSNNVKSPRCSSADAGMQGRPRGDFNWMTGMPS